MTCKKQCDPCECIPETFEYQESDVTSGVKLAAIAIAIFIAYVIGYNVAAKNINDDILSRCGTNDIFEIRGREGQFSCYRADIAQ